MATDLLTLAPRPLPVLALRARFALGVAAMLLPPALLIVLGIVVLDDLTDRLSHLMGEVTHEIHPVVEVQERLLRTAALVEAVSRRNAAPDRDRLGRSAHDVGTGFRDLLQGPLHVPGARLAIESAESHWRQAEALLAPFLDRRAAPGGQAAVVTITQYLDRATGLLGEVHVLAKRNIEDEYASTLVMRDRVVIIMAVLLLAVLIAAIAGFRALARSVFRPLSALTRAADCLAKGDLAHRVEPATMPRELQRLANAFNFMAEKLGKSLAELEALASRDGLTGLFNHRTFHAILAAELDRSRRFGHALSLLMIDIDHFKRVNDSFGHQAGDAALESLGQLLIRETRAVDCAARYGGEELAVLLPETDAAGAGLVAERIRASIQAGPIASAGGAPVALTVTVGAASFPAHAADAQALVAAADAALYAGKRAGRNRVVLAGEAAA